MQFDLFRNAKATDAGAALNHASMASTVLEKIAALMAMRSRSDMVFFRLPCAFQAAE